MKRIEAIIRPERLQAVKTALIAADYPGLTISEVQGHGKQRGIAQQWRGHEYRVDLLPKGKGEVVVRDGDVERLVEAISGNACTGNAGDGKIFISEVTEVVRIRTGERGEGAL